MTGKHKILFISNDPKKGYAANGSTVFEVLEKNDISVRSDCGQKGTCGKCRVIVDIPENLNEISRTEKKILSAVQLASQSRLACQAKVFGPVSITIPKESLVDDEVHCKTGVKGVFPVNPAIRRIFVAPEELQPTGKNKNHQSLAEKIVRKISGNEKSVLNRVSLLSTIEQHGGQDIGRGLTIVHHETLGVISILAGRHETSLGIAFDLGTTTIAAYLCDLRSGKIVAAKATVNPQRQYGEDVISRISAVSEDERNLKTLQRLVIAAMNKLIRSCLVTTGYAREDVDEITVVGNTTMEHILAGINPKSLGVYPYLPVTCCSIQKTASSLGLHLLRETPVYIFPIISAFLGGDILSALLADRSYDKKGSTLIIDIGTNGELILNASGKLWATSCATGPAFEGAQISCGMRASDGAVSKVFFDSQKNKIGFETINNTEPTGICGSGVIDALATMRKADIILANGTLNTKKTGVTTDERGNGRTFTLPGSTLTITLRDVRQVQLAKAALFIGIESLLKSADIAKVDRTILTGAFGARFNWRNALNIGMLPSILLEGQVESMENLAGTGAVLALLDKDRRAEIEAIAGTINFLDLSCDPDFTAKFSQATQFPAVAKH